MHFFVTILTALKKNLTLQILVAMGSSIMLACYRPDFAIHTVFLGDLFITALKSIAPLLIIILIASAIGNQNTGTKSTIKPVFLLYITGTISAASIAVIISLLLPVKVALIENTGLTPIPGGIKDILSAILFRLIDNPVNALIEANYLGLLVWGIGFGITLTKASDSTKQVFADISDCISQIVRFIIRFAPIGIFGLTAQTILNSGLKGLTDYIELLSVLLLAMAIFALIINPLLVYIRTRSNPYPLLFTCLKESGTTAFFTRSSAANIPINLALCEKLNLNRDTYSVSIPLGAAINTGGAAITITVLTLAAVNSLDIQVDFITTLLLVILSSLCACGASGVTGGSLLLIPLSCSLFGINNETAMSIVAVGFMIGIVQDAVETAVNSSTDVFYTAACAENKKNDYQKLTTDC